MKALLLALLLASPAFAENYVDCGFMLYNQSISTPLEAEMCQDLHLAQDVNDESQHDTEVIAAERDWLYKEINRLSTNPIAVRKLKLKVRKRSFTKPSLK